MRDAQQLADAILANGSVVKQQPKQAARLTARWGRLKFSRTFHPLASTVTWFDRHTHAAPVCGQFFDYRRGFRELTIWHKATPIERDTQTKTFRRPSWAS